MPTITKTSPFECYDAVEVLIKSLTNPEYLDWNAYFGAHIYQALLGDEIIQARGNNFVVPEVTLREMSYLRKLGALNTDNFIKEVARRFTHVALVADVYDQSPL